jgi:hypothetical protein
MAAPPVLASNGIDLLLVDQLVGKGIGTVKLAKPYIMPAE